MKRRIRKPGKNCRINPQIVKGCAMASVAEREITEASRRFRELTDLSALLDQHAYEHMGVEV